MSVPSFAEGRRADKNFSFTHSWAPNNINRTSRLCLNIYSNIKTGPLNC